MKKLKCYTLRQNAIIIFLATFIFPAMECNAQSTPKRSLLALSKTNHTLAPLLKNRKIDFALVFAVSENQLNGILKDVMPSLKDGSKFWVAYPKTTSKIVTDLNRECSWNRLTGQGYESIERVELDHVWSAMRFTKGDNLRGEEVAVSRKRQAAAMAE